MSGRVSAAGNNGPLRKTASKRIERIAESITQIKVQSLKIVQASPQKTDKYHVKQLQLFILFALLATGCVTKKIAVEPESVRTIQSDMFPKDLSRAEYYEQMAIAYSLDNQVEKAIENFRLSILHNPKRASAFINLSDEYRKANRNHLALVELSEAHKLEPGNLEILKKTGDLYLAAKIYSKARETYQLMLQKNSKFEEAKWALFYLYKIEKKYSDALNMLAGINKDSTNDFKIMFEKAMLYKLTREDELYVSNLTLAYEMNPRDRQIVLEYTGFAYSQKKFKDSTAALLKYSDTKEFDFEISQNLSYSAVQSENYEIAMREYSKQRPLTYDARLIDLKKAHVHYLMGELNNAEKLYLSLLKQEENEEARFFLAQIYISQDKSEDAAFILSKIPVSSEYFGDAKVRLALYSKHKGLPDDAVNIIRSAYIQRPDSLPIYKTYADFLIELNRYVESVALLEKGIKLFPNDEELRLKMAFLHYRLNNQRAFKKEIFAALKINSESAAVYSMLAELWYLKNKKPEEVIYFVKKAVQLKSDNKNVKPLLAWALMQLDHSTEAVALFEEFFEENPKESFFARSLSTVYSRGDVNKKSQALAELATALESSDSLKSRFIFNARTQQVQDEDYKLSPTRLPASLENK